jgi:hypothetical protein
VQVPEPVTAFILAIVVVAEQPGWLAFGALIGGVDWAGGGAGRVRQRA